MRRWIVVLVATALLAAACAGDDTTEQDTTGPPPTNVPAPADTTTSTGPPTGRAAGVELARAEVPRATSTDVTDTELTDLVAGNAEFAFDLFRQAAVDGRNVVVSPYSVAAALTMTYAGARGETAAEMREVLRFGLPDDRLHAARNELDLQVTAEASLPPEDDREPFSIRVANSLWGQAGYPFLEDYLTLLARDYDAGMNLVDFQSSADEARRTINGWVEDQTEGRIVDLIPEGVVTDLTRLVVVNAIWFKASWAEQFDPALTEDGPFGTLGGSTVAVPMMHGGGKLPYTAGDGYQVLTLPYAGDAAMRIVLPDPGRFEEVASTFGAEELAAARSAQSTHQVALTMPKFEFRTELSLRPALEELGMVAAFVEPSTPGGADFTGMTEQRELFVHAVVHQAFIAVDEEGTEAAAATAVVIGLESASPPATVTIDRPFLFLIEHTGTGEILFLGQVTDPS